MNSALLILGLSIAVLCVGSVVVTYLSAKGYLLTGSLTLLFVTLAFIVVGCGSTVSALFASLSANASVTAAAIALLLFSTLQLLSSIQASFRSVSIGTEHRKYRLALASSGVFVLIVLIAFLIGYDVLPSFFINGLGVTLVDQVVYAIVVLFFGVGSVLFLRQYLKSKSNVLYWYTLALVLDAIGAFGLTLQVRFSDIVVWTGRLGIYLAIIYFLIALLSVREENNEV